MQSKKDSMRRLTARIIGSESELIVKSAFFTADSLDDGKELYREALRDRGERRRSGSG